jgi:hypothetical protein
MVLFGKSTDASANAYKDMLKAAGKNILSRDTLESAYKRILDLKDGFDSPGD